jgi:hypothetical protein
MENQFLDQDAASNNGRGLSSLDKEFLNTAAYWARFLGIVGYVVTGFIVLAALFFMFGMSSFMSALGDANSAGALSLFAGAGTSVGILYFLVAALYFFMSRYLYNFGVNTKRAMATGDSNNLTAGLENLKSYFKLFGILTAVFLALYGIILLFAIVAGIFASSL